MQNFRTIRSLETIGAYLLNIYYADTPLWFLTNELFVLTLQNLIHHLYTSQRNFCN